MKVIGRWMPMLGLATCLAAAGCKKEEAKSTTPDVRTADAGAAPAPGASATPTPPPPAPTAQDGQAVPPEDVKSPEWTASIVDVQRSGLKPVTMTEVRTARNEGFDRVVFQFAGDQLPGYHVEYIDEPVVKCGSGDTTAIAGQGWLRVRIQPAQAHENGQVTVAERERKPGLPVLQELELTCDFEADVTWVLGVKNPNPYRVMELREPTRLVVDVRH